MRSCIGWSWSLLNFAAYVSTLISYLSSRGCRLVTVSIADTGVLRMAPVIILMAWCCTLDSLQEFDFALKYSTNFKAEAEALKKAAIEIRNNLPRTKPNVVTFTDLSLSSANSKIPTRKISVRWKLPWLTSQPRQT